MATDTLGYSKSVQTQTGTNTQTIFEEALLDGQARTYEILITGSTADFKFARKWTKFTVFNDGGTATFVDIPVIDIITEYADAGLASPPSYSFSVTLDVLSLSITGPSDGELMTWKADIEWSQY